MPKKSFGGSAEREDALINYERDMQKFMRKAIRDALRTKGIKHHVRDGAVIIKKQHLQDETWEHRFTIDSYANHI